MDCDCRADQVLCFWRHCPRAVRLRAQQRAANIKAREMLGDPIKGVSLGEQPK